MYPAPPPRLLSAFRWGILLSVLTASFPWTTVDPLGIVVALAWAFFAVALLSWQIATGLILTATSTASFFLAYSQGLGTAAAEGDTINGITASSGGALSALAMLVIFLMTVVLTASFVRNGARRLAPRAPEEGPRPDIEIALLLALVVCFVTAVGAEMWTFWGGERTEPLEEGGIRLELLYPSVLLAIIGYYALSRLARTPSRLTLTTAIVGAIVAVLVFALQSRRIMIAGAVMLALATLVSAARFVSGRLVIRLVAVVGLLAVFTLASSGWRETGDVETLSLSERVEHAIDAVGDAKSIESIESRLTYLWFDAMCHELHDDQGADLDGGALFVSNVASALPRVLFPAKESVRTTTCESGLEGFWGMEVDLPCTPTGEGYLIGGLLGVLLAGLLWGLALGVVEAAVERGPGIWRVFGLFMLLPFVLVEAGVFAFVPALRSGLLGAALVASFAGLVRLVQGRRLRRAPQQSP